MAPAGARFSATAMAIRMQDQLAGLVLSSSVVSLKKPGAVPSEALAAIRRATLARLWALNWHGFVGMEREAVDLIAEWLRKPVE